MSRSRIIEAIHASPLYGAFAVAGGARAIAEILEVPGASATIAEAVIPYSAAALAEYLGGEPDRACAPETARAMAMAAFQRSLRFPPADKRHAFGIGCTAALRTLRRKRGDHRAFVAAQTLEATHTWSLTLHKGARNRDQEEEVVAGLLIAALACIADVAAPPLPLLDGELVRHDIHHGEADWQRLLLGEVRAVCLHQDLVGPSDPGKPRIVFPGAFNPHHAGHERMARHAQERLGGVVEYEICVRNVDKPPLNYADISERVDAFPGDHRIWLTSAATFAEKAELFPGAVFVVGLDTIVRIAEERYYDGDPGKRDEAIRRISAAGCRFLVFGRKMGESFVLLRDVKLPEPLAAICEEVAASDFRMDLSSSAIRARNTAG